MPTFEEYQQYAEGFVTTNTMFYDAAMFKPEPPQKVVKNPRLLKDLENDLVDLLMHLLKGQPRVVKSEMLSHRQRAQGGRHFERDEAAFRGIYEIYFSGSTIGIVICRPHKELKIDRLWVQNRGMPRYTQSLLVKLMYELFPSAKVEVLNGK